MQLWKVEPEKIHAGLLGFYPDLINVPQCIALTCWTSKPTAGSWSLNWFVLINNYTRERRERWRLNNEYMNFITGTVERKEDPTCSERCNLCSCKKEIFPWYNRPFYRCGGHIELIRFKKYYRMPRGHEHISFVFSSAFRDIFS